LFGGFQLSAWSWFTLFWVLFTTATIAMLARHQRRPIAMIPSSWLGKGQLFYLMFLWLIVIANFSKALVAFSDSRIGTEGTVMINALICTILILCWVPTEKETVSVAEIDYGLLIRRSLLWLCILLLATTTFYTTGIRAIYGDQWTGWGGNNRRFGPDAD